ncbi:MAG: alpha-2-macroglobulin family protein, partial [Candidatus Hodarchaeota archaeon]
LYVLEPKSSFSIQIENSMLLAPNFALNAYLIDRQGFLQTASLRIEVNGSVSLDIQFDKPRYEPGDSVEVSMMMKNALGSYIPAIGAISLIDSSVYGVLPDPEEEAEHFEEETYYPVVMTRSSWMGGDFYWWWIFYDIVYGGSYGFARGGGYPEYYLAEDTEYFSIESTRREFTPSPQQEVKIRDNLPEAAYWHPEISLTTSDTELSLVLPDNIGEWTVRVVATTASGQGVLQKASLTTFLPFFVDLEKPLVLSQDDVIAVKGVAYNYLNETASIDLKLNVSTGLEPLIASEQSLIIPPLHLGSIEWPVYIESFGKMDASLIGVARTTEGTWTDGIRVPLSVLPNGAYRIERQGGYLNESANLPINISQSAISVQGTLILSPGLSNVALSSWERLIGYPYGCTEQTLSRILPDALVYAYLNQTDQLDPDTAKELENMIIVGLSRLYAFQKSSGGWGWWSDDHHNTYMTAIVLYGLGLIHNVGFEVEMDVLSSGAEYLLNAQDSDFLWRTSVWRLDSYSFTAFVLRSLLFANESYVSQPKVYSAYSKLKALWNESKNPYAAALLLDGLGGSSILETDFEGELISYLQSSANHVETGSFWTIDDHRWRALGGDVETTAIALTALARWDLASSFSLIQRAIDWITTKQQPWGWGSTADTSAAIRALLTVDDMVSNEDTEAEIHVILNGNDQIFPFSSKSPESMVSTVIKLGNELHEGMNTLQITQNGTGFFFYLLTVEQVLRDDPTIEIEGNIDTSPGSEFPVSITLLPPSADVRIVDLQVKSLEMDLPISTSDTRTLTTLSEKITFVFVYTSLHWMDLK